MKKDGPPVKVKEVKTKEKSPKDPKMVQEGHLVELQSHNPGLRDHIAVFLTSSSKV